MGYFDSEEGAGRAYDMKFIELHGLASGEARATPVSSSPAAASRALHATPCGPRMRACAPKPLTKPRR
jgi:hypothetical protein